MAELSVQVPVSLIENIDRDLGENAWHPEDCPGSHPAYCTCAVGKARRELRALLSQPTAEPDRVIVTRNQIENAVTEVVEDGEWSDAEDLPKLIVNAILYRSNYLPDAAPPSITDMVPGTTFYAVLIGTGRFEQWMRVNSCHPVARMRDGLHAEANSLDPSTIRDVRGPEQ